MNSEKNENTRASRIVEVFRYTGSGFEPATLEIAEERHLALRVNGNAFVVLACSGKEPEALAAGYLLSEGIIDSYSDIEGIEFDGESINVRLRISDAILERMMSVRTIPSGCGSAGGAACPQPGPFHKPVTIAAAAVFGIMFEFLGSSALYKTTRGVHGAGLYSVEGKNILFFDDIGRHNAVDTVIGHCAMHGIDLRDKVLAITGRVSADIMQKSLFSGIGIVITRSVPTSVSFEAAREADILMIGRVRKGEFIVFSGRERVIG